MQKKYADSKITILLLGLDSLEKDRENREKLFREHHIGCGGVNLFLLKYVTNTTPVTTVTITAITTVTIWIFEFCHNLIFLSFVKKNLKFFFFSQVDFLSLVTIIFF